MEAAKFHLGKNPVHLGLGAKVSMQPEFSGMEWYADYGARTQTDGVEGRLVSMHRYSSPWTTWEMHPEGEELVVCVSGRMTLIQELDGKEVRVEMEPGEAIINPRGVWHTSDTNEEVTAFFITSGVGTQIRPR